MTTATITNLWAKIRQRFAALPWRQLRSRRALTVMGALIVFAGVGLAFSPAQAIPSIDEIVVAAIGFIVQTLVSFLGQILLLVVGVLINVAQYNKFVTSPVVGTGWVIVRDVVNMFFIVVLLIMAFGTILGVQAYSIKGGNLTRLIIMAIVINFSRTICGLMIDFGQVVMLTFVSGFKDAAGGNFVEAMKINEILQPNASSANVSTTGIVISLILALVMVAIATFVVIMMTVALTIRIVYLWLLIVLSPIAFFLKAVPGGQASKAYADWWSKFTSNLLFGPVMAFFLWLSLVTVQQGNIAEGFKTDTTGESISDAVSGAFNSTSLQTFIVAVCLLIGGYQIAMELGGSTTGMANKAVKKAAGEFTKRSGIDSYLAQRRQAREEKYAARGAAISKGTGMVQLATSKVLSTPTNLIGAGISKAGRLGKEGGVFRRAAEATGKAVQQRGIVGAIAAAPGQGIKRLGQKLGEVSEAKEGEGIIKRGLKAVGRGTGAGMVVTGGAVVGVAKLASPANIIAESGRGDFNRGRDYKYKKVQQDMAGLANRKDSEIKDLAAGNVPGAKTSEQQAAILKLMEKGYVATPEDMESYRGKLQTTDADPATREAYDRMAREKFPGALPPATEFDMNRAHADSKFDSTKLKTEQLEDVASKHGSIAAGAEKRKSEERIIDQSDATREPYLRGVRKFLALKESPDIKPGMNEAAKSKLKLEFEQKQAAARGTLARMDKVNGSRDAYGIENGQFVGDDKTRDANMKKFAADMTRPGAQESMMNIPAEQIMKDGQVTAVGAALITAIQKANNKPLSAAPGVTDRTPEQDSALKAIVEAVKQNGNDDQKSVIGGRAFAGVGGGRRAVEEEDEDEEGGAGKRRKPKVKATDTGSGSSSWAPPSAAAVAATVAGATAAAAAPAAPKKGPDEVSPIVTASGGTQPTAAAQAAAAAAQPEAQKAELSAITDSIRELESAFKESRQSNQPVIVQGQKLDTRAIEMKLSEANRKFDQLNASVKEGNKPSRPT